MSQDIFSAYIFPFVLYYKQKINRISILKYIHWISVANLMCFENSKQYFILNKHGVVNSELSLSLIAYRYVFKINEFKHDFIWCSCY